MNVIVQKKPSKESEATRECACLTDGVDAAAAAVVIDRQMFHMLEYKQGRPSMKNLSHVATPGSSFVLGGVRSLTLYAEFL